MIELLVVLIVLGLVFYLVSALLPIPAPFKTVIYVVLVLIVIIYLLSLIGVVGGGPSRLRL